MAYNQSYYEEKLKDIVEQVNKLVQKKTNTDYEFVREHSELVEKYKKVELIMKEEMSKNETKKVQKV